VRQVAIIDFGEHPIDLEVTSSTNWRFSQHWDSTHLHTGYYDLHYIAEGGMTLDEPDGRRLGKGDILIRFPNTQYGFRVSPSTRIIYGRFVFRNTSDLQTVVEDEKAWLARTRRRPTNDWNQSLLAIPDVVHVHPSHDLARLINTLPDAADIPSGLLYAKALWLRLLTGLSRMTFEQQKKTGRIKNAITGYVERALDYIENHLADPISASDIACQLGITTDHLGRVFKNSMGMSIGMCLVRCRMAKARRLLSEGRLSIQTIARSSGYRDARHFSRIFKREAGLLPSEWRVSGQGEGHASRE
jgi:AraC-like DNA-binding protein